MNLFPHSDRTPPPSTLYSALAVFSLVPTFAVALAGDAPFAAWSITATFIVAAAWPIAQRLHAMFLPDRTQNRMLRNHLATAADSSLRAEGLLAANGQRLQEIAEQIRIAALNVRLQAMESAEADCPLAAVAEDLETLARRAEKAGRAALRSSNYTEIGPALSDEATQNLSRLTEELHSISATLDRDLKRTSISA